MISHKSELNKLVMEDAPALGTYIGIWHARLKIKFWAPLIEKNYIKSSVRVIKSAIINPAGQVTGIRISGQYCHQKTGPAAAAAKDIDCKKI